MLVLSLLLFTMWATGDPLLIGLDGGWLLDGGKALHTCAAQHNLTV
jgi:hypothetical protein